MARDDAARWVLTGPTGWIGTAFLADFAARFGPAWTARTTLFGSAARELVAPDGARVPVRPLPTITGDDVRDAHVVHLAYLTKEKVAHRGEGPFLAENAAIDAHVLAAFAAGAPRAVFVASSGAARQAETGVGREPYGVSKLLQEDKFIDFGRRAGVPALVGRIFNLAGPHINKTQSYAIAAFLRQALAEGRIDVSATTPVYRSYLHVGDLCALVQGALALGWSPAGAVDLCGPLVVEMQDVAAEAARAAGLEASAVRRGPIDWTRPSVYLGDPTPARTLTLRLGLALRPFSTQVDDTAADLRSRGLAG